MRAIGLATVVVAALVTGGQVMAAGGSQPAGAGLTATERRIVDAVDANHDAAVALLERVVNINSGTMNVAGVRQVGDVFREAFDRLGFRTRWIDGAPFGRAGHLVAEKPGPGPRLLLIGHLDTVFEADSPFQTFERRSPSEARGPGITDMKGGDVIILQALTALQQAGALDGLHVSVIMTGDEEDVGDPAALARQPLIDLAKASDVAIGFEDGASDPKTAVISRRGFTGWTLKVKGTPAHSSQIFQPTVGGGAIFEAARILNGFYERLSREPMLSLNPGAIVGGTTVDFDATQSRGSAFGKTNVVAEHAVVTGDLRTLSPEQRTAAKQAMTEVVAAHLPRTSAELTFDDSYPPMAPTDANRELLGLYNRASLDVGAGAVTAVDPRNAGAADVSFTAPHVRMAIDGIGLMGRGGHTVNETADLTTLPSQTKRAALLLYRLSQTVR